MRTFEEEHLQCFWIVIVITAAAVLWGPFLLTACSKSLIRHKIYYGFFRLVLSAGRFYICRFLSLSHCESDRHNKTRKTREKPEFGLLSWFAMLFSAGMGIGLVFYGAAEPISHYAISSPSGETETPQAFRDALRYTFFHWGCTLGPSMRSSLYVSHIFNSEKTRPV